MEDVIDKSKNSKTPLIEYLKLINGRVLLTVFCGAAFLQVVYCVCHVIMMKSADITINDLNGLFNMLMLIISNVITFYFTKESNKKDKLESDG